MLADVADQRRRQRTAVHHGQLQVGPGQRRVQGPEIPGPLPERRGLGNHDGVEFQPPGLLGAQ
ncbi:hypothetical protein SDC9_101258 [bioreactor metagenome]|uniref:Uncharacterized protein n=1 Tax=bioreactor metagenome TaxID=1076179 RepID=A0A645AMY8_9ZZZZ